MDLPQVMENTQRHSGSLSERCVAPCQLNRMTRRRNSEQTKDPDTLASRADLMAMDLSKVSKTDFRVAVMKTTVGQEKNINGNIDSLRAEVRADLKKVKTLAMRSSQIGTLTVWVDEAEE